VLRKNPTGVAILHHVDNCVGRNREGLPRLRGKNGWAARAGSGDRLEIARIAILDGGGGIGRLPVLGGTGGRRAVKPEVMPRKTNSIFMAATAAGRPAARLVAKKSELLQADFVSTHQITGKKVYFTILLGIKWNLRGAPVQIRYQPELVVSDGVEFNVQ
jgi:hypothetical protein